MRALTEHENDCDYRIYVLVIVLMLINMLAFMVGSLGIGNDIYSYLTGRGVFDDYFNLFKFADRIPDPKDAAQYTSFSIVMGRYLQHKILIGLVGTYLFGVMLPLLLVLRGVAKRVDRGAWVYILLVACSYPVLFAYFRGNPLLAAFLWVLASVFQFYNRDVTASGISVIIGSLFHPTAAVFSLMFLREGLLRFMVQVVAIVGLQVLFYAGLGDSLLHTYQAIMSSLIVYRDNYVMGSGGDLYNNSLFMLLKIMIYSKREMLILAMELLPLPILSLVCVKLLFEMKQSGSRTAIMVGVLYYLPIALVLASPVSGDYRLVYLLIPLMSMIVMREWALNTYVLLAVIVPKHFVFYSTYWLNLHKGSPGVYPDLIPTLGITLNTLINPALLLACLMLSHLNMVKVDKKVFNVGE